MGPIDPEASAKLQAELLSGESILWAGRPDPSVIFHSDDWYLVPFSLAWVALTAFWEAGVLGYWGNSAKNGPSLFMALWGIPFIVIGQYMLWGPLYLRRMAQAQNVLRRNQPSNPYRSGRMAPKSELHLH